MIAPGNLEVLSFLPEQQEPIFLPVMCVTRRDYDGDLLEVRTKMGRRVRCTPDHPFLVTDAGGAPIVRKLAEDLTPEDWLPLATERDERADAAKMASILSAVGRGGALPGEAHRAPACTRDSQAGRPAHRRAARDLPARVVGSRAHRRGEANRGAQAGRGRPRRRIPSRLADRHHQRRQLRELRDRALRELLAHRRPVHRRGLRNQNRGPSSAPVVVPSRARGAPRSRGGARLVAVRNGGERVQHPHRAKGDSALAACDHVVVRCPRTRAQQLRAATSRPHLGPPRARQVGPPRRAVRGRRLVVAPGRRAERHHRVRDGQRRTRRWRAATARRTGDRRLTPDRPDAEVDEGHALDSHQRSRPDRARDRAHP